MKINNKIFFRLIFLLIPLSLVFSKSKDVTSVSNSILFGYDSNVSKISLDEEIDYNDSPYISIRSTLRRNFQVLKNKKRKTKVSFSTKLNYYSDVKQKSNIGYYFNISQSIGNYQSLKFYHAYINDIYIREFSDLDNLIDDGIYSGSECYFDLIKYRLSYESPYFGDKEKIEINAYNELQYFSPEFTEYDLSIIGVGIKYFTKRSDNRFNIHLGYAQADSLYSHSQDLLTGDYGGNTLRLVDRSYEEVSLKFSYDLPIVDDKIIGFSVSRKQRKYLSEIDYASNGDSIVDELHKDRKHRDFVLNTWLIFNNGNRKNKITFSYREKITTSPYSWVENLKSFSKFNLEYVIYFNKVKLNI